MNPTAYNSMMIISSIWGMNKTFRLLPVDEACPYVESIYDPESKVLVVISKLKKQSYHMVPQLDDQGDQVPAKRARANGKAIKEERRLMDTYQEYYLVVNEEIEEFIKNVAVNADKYDFMSFVNAPVASPNGMVQAMESPATV